MTIIDVVGDNVITVDVHSLCRLRGQVDRRATPMGRCEIALASLRPRGLPPVNGWQGNVAPVLMLLKSAEPKAMQRSASTTMGILVKFFDSPGMNVGDFRDLSWTDARREGHVRLVRG